MECPKCGHIFLSKPRTTGPRSQSAHLHGHLQSIAKFTGYTMGEVKELMKRDCADWPYKMVTFAGKAKMVPKSEADVDTVAEAAAIEWCHGVAAQIGCMLVESEEI